MADPPPPPPPHGQNPRPPGGLPDGNYDIFIIPPHSAGGGFLYLPSLKPELNSFIAGVAVTLVTGGVVYVVTPVLRTWLTTIMAGNAWGVLILMAIVAVCAWMYGKMGNESFAGAWQFKTAPGASHSQPHQEQQHRQNNWQAPQPEQQQQQPPPQPPPPPQSEAKPNSTQTGWEKAKEETRKREEARKRTEEFERRRAEAAKAKEEAERQAKAKAEKERWEQQRAREKEQRERLAREQAAKDKPASPTPEKISIAERMERLRKDREERQKAASSPSATGRTSPRKEYVRPTARSAVGTEDQYSYRPYDTPPKPRQAYHASSASSVSGLSESSYAASQTTAQTTPPASMRGPYSTKDPDKIQIRAVYLFNDSFPTKPIAQLVVGQGNVSDGLILNVRTEGLFIDDDVRKVPQREWDIKAWTLRSVEDGALKGSVVGGAMLHVLRASVRNAENSKYCFILDQSEAWKVAKGLQRLRDGSQVRSLNMSSMKEDQVRSLLRTTGWL